jgi:hypothetical protein
MRYFTIVIVTLTCFIFFVGCSNSDETVQPNNQTGDTLFVTSSYTGGISDGTATRPFRTIGEGIAAAHSGQTIYISAGNYETLESFPIYLKPGVTYSGAGNIFTFIYGEFTDSSAHDSTPIVLEHFRFNGLNFDRGAALDTPLAFNIVNDCLIHGDINIDHGGSHNFKIENNDIYGSINIAHGPGSSFNIIRNNVVQGSIELSHGNAITDSIIGNLMSGGDIIDNSGFCNTFINGNTINGGRIIDRSGNGLELITGNHITFNATDTTEDPVALDCRGVSVIAIRNIINCNGTAAGIVLRSGTPTVVDSNTITVSGQVACLSSLAGGGQLVGNHLTGGLYGIFDRSGATHVAYNVITSADTGVYTQSLAKYEQNTITNCSAVGMVLDGVRGPIEGNIVSNNGGAGVILLHPVDLGGGADSCIGGNSFTNNGAFDLVNRTPNPIEAKHNHWDHSTAPAIDSLDIYDNDQDSTLGEVDFVPFD